MSRSRSDTLPYGALVLERLLAKSQGPKDMVVSIYGVREGLLYSKLTEAQARSGRAALVVLGLLLPLCPLARARTRTRATGPTSSFAHQRFEENRSERRLRHAACLLADIGWRAHPDYRAERSLGMISQAAFVDIDHPGRVFLALTIFYRYEGPDERGCAQGFVAWSTSGSSSGPSF